VSAAADHVIDFDHNDPDLVREPYSTYRRLRDECPVAHGNGFGGFWVYSRYEDIVAAEMDPATYASGMGVTIPELGPVRSVPLEVDPPEHRDYRALLQPHFSRPSMARFEGRIREITRDHLAAFADRGNADLASELAAHVPPLVLAELFGLPAEDSPHFQHLATTLVAGTEASMAAGQELMAYLQGHLAARLKEPRDDLATVLAHARLPDRELLEEERLGMAQLVVVAGHETTVGSIASMVAMVGADPALQDRILADRSFIPAVVEESLRLEAPVQNFARTLTCPVERHGMRMAAGDRVMLLFGSGNRDERRFEDPDEFRTDRSPNSHLTFGAGIHRCLGAALGQLEMRVVLEEVLEAIPGFRVDPDRIEVTGLIARVFTSVPATWPVRAADAGGAR
jgi:cytochrome P450